MTRQRTTIYLTLLAVGLLASTNLPTTLAQSGGGFEITEAVVATGADSSSNGIFAIDSTIAQPASGGAIDGAPFSVTSGFWNFTSLAPTAAAATISGQVRTAAGDGITGAMLYLQTRTGEIYVRRSGSFGYFMFEGIEIGQSVFITVEHRRFTFEPRTVMVVDSVTDLDFIPQQ